MVDVEMVRSWLADLFPDVRFVTGADETGDDVCIVTEQPGGEIVMEGLYHWVSWGFELRGEQFDHVGRDEVAAAIDAAVIDIDCPHQLWGNRCIEVGRSGPPPFASTTPDDSQRKVHIATYSALVVR